MKTLAAFALTVLAMILGLNSTAQAAPANLHDAMKEMSKVLRTIDSQADDGAQNVESARLSDQFVELVLACKKFVPDTVAELPAGDRSAAQSRYIKLLDDTAQYGRALATAFRRGDNAKAVEIIDALNKAKKQGHGEFK